MHRSTWVPSGNATALHAQVLGQSSLQVTEHRPPLPPAASTQYPDAQSVFVLHAAPNAVSLASIATASPAAASRFPRVADEHPTNTMQIVMRWLSLVIRRRSSPASNL